MLYIFCIVAGVMREDFDNRVRYFVPRVKTLISLESSAKRYT